MALASLGIVSNPGGTSEVNGLVSQLMAIERQPLVVTHQREARVQAQLSAYGRLQSQIALFGDAAESLGKPGKLAPVSVNIADAEVATVSAGSGAVIGNYSLEVKRLAKGEILTTAVLPSASGKVGAGALTITLGDIDHASRIFTPRGDRTPLKINIDASNNTLTGVRDAINASRGESAGVIATIVADGGGARMEISSTETGARNAIKIDAPGLDAFAFDPASGVKQSVSQSQAAQNSSINVDGTEIVSATNRISGAIEGVTIDLAKAKKGQPTTVTIASNSDGAKLALREFVGSYNALSTMARSYTKYDVTTKIKGALQGEATALSVINELQAMVSGAIPGSAGDFTQLKDIGISLRPDGTLQLDEAKLDAVTSSPSGARKLMGLFTDAAARPESYVTRFKAFVEKTQGSSGLIPSTTEGLSTTMQRLDKERENIQQRLAGVEHYLREQFNALDARPASHAVSRAYAATQGVAWSGGE